MHILLILLFALSTLFSEDIFFSSITQKPDYYGNTGYKNIVVTNSFNRSEADASFIFVDNNETVTVDRFPNVDVTYSDVVDKSEVSTHYWCADKWTNFKVFIPANIKKLKIALGMNPSISDVRIHYVFRPLDTNSKVVMNHKTFEDAKSYNLYLSENDYNSRQRDMFRLLFHEGKTFERTGTENLDIVTITKEENAKSYLNKSGYMYISILNTNSVVAKTRQYFSTSKAFINYQITFNENDLNFTLNNLQWNNQNDPYESDVYANVIHNSCSATNTTSTVTSENITIDASYVNSLRALYSGKWIMLGSSTTINKPIGSVFHSDGKDTIYSFDETIQNYTYNPTDKIHAGRGFWVNLSSENVQVQTTTTSVTTPTATSSSTSGNFLP